MPDHERAVRDEVHDWRRRGGRRLMGRSNLCLRCAHPDYWSAKLEKCPRELLRVIYEHGQKRSLTREFIADNAVNGDGHYSSGSSTFSNSLSRLRVLELIKGTGDSIQLSDTFFE